MVIMFVATTVGTAEFILQDKICNANNFKIRILTLNNFKADLMKDSRELHSSFIETCGTFFGLQDRLAVRFSKSALYTFVLFFIPTQGGKLLRC